jgi:hypothetical protein
MIELPLTTTILTGLRLDVLVSALNLTDDGDRAAHGTLVVDFGTVHLTRCDIILVASGGVLPACRTPAVNGLT